MSWDTERDDIMDALLGKQGVRISHTSLGEIVGKPEPYRKRDGVWFGPDEPRYTRIVGVLVAQLLHPWTVCKPLDLRLYHNPYVEQPLDVDFSRLAQATPDHDTLRMTLTNGEACSAILDLPHDWPIKGQKK